MKKYRYALLVILILSGAGCTSMPPKSNAPPVPKISCFNEKKRSWSNCTLSMRDKAAAGDAEAQFRVGKSYLDGGYTDLQAKQAWADAMPWFQKSADQDYGPAEFWVASCARSGLCPRKSPAEIAALERKSAEHGYYAGQDALSHDYYVGDGVGQNYAYAYFWYLVSKNTLAKQHRVISGSREYLSRMTPDDEKKVAEKAKAWEKTHPVPPYQLDVGL